MIIYKKIRLNLCFWLMFPVILTISSIGSAQENSETPNTLERGLFKDILKDQRSIWTSPKQLKSHDLKWLIPFAGITTAMIATDNHVSKGLSYSDKQLSVSHNVSNIGLDCMYGAAGALYLSGRLGRREYRAKTGILEGEAIAGSAIVVRLLKIAAGRQRPTGHDNQGQFWAGGESFPSGHSISAWSAAAVLATRYPHRQWIKVSAYGAASAISIARFTGKNHYPSDVFVGGVLGYFIGHHIGLDRH
jgi:hypothetical protein